MVSMTGGRPIAVSSLPDTDVMVPQGPSSFPSPMQNGSIPDPPRKGEKAIITSGPFEGKTGTIAAVEGDVATLAVDVFAQDTPVQVPLADLIAPT
jgi:KOW motif